jgi:hypothetical protein
MELLPSPGSSSWHPQLPEPDRHLPDVDTSNTAVNGPRFDQVCPLPVRQRRRVSCA